MMSKEQYIDFWLKNADEDLDTALYNFEGGRNVYCLFFLHLSIEKTLISILIKNNISNTFQTSWNYKKKARCYRNELFQTTINLKKN